VEEQLRLATARAAKPCVLALTLLPRCFNGTTMAERKALIHDFFRTRGWEPAMGNDALHASTLFYVTDNRSTPAFTQVWTWK
jgi:hypothetical protein